MIVETQVYLRKCFVFFQWQRGENFIIPLAKTFAETVTMHVFDVMVPLLVLIFNNLPDNQFINNCA